MLAYSTYLGGDSTDTGHGIEVDGEGNAFVAKLSPEGSSLVYSTLVGGATGLDLFTDIKLDPLNNAHVIGQSNSTDYPDWVEVSFTGAKKVDEVNVFSLQDNYTSAAEPTEGMTCTKYGVTSFEVQFWDGATWVTVPSGVVTNNGLVWRKVTFSEVTTTKVRVVIHNAVGGRSRLVEAEAVGPAS